MRSIPIHPTRDPRKGSPGRDPKSRTEQSSADRLLSRKPWGIYPRRPCMTTLSQPQSGQCADLTGYCTDIGLSTDPSFPTVAMETYTPLHTSSQVSRVVLDLWDRLFPAVRFQSFVKYFSSPAPLPPLSMPGTPSAPAFRTPDTWTRVKSIWTGAVSGVIQEQRPFMPVIS